MGELFMARMSDGQCYLIEVQRYAISDYRARVSTKCLLSPVTDASATDFIAYSYSHDWLDIHSASTKSLALNAAIETLVKHCYSLYLVEVCPVNEPTRTELQASLAKALEVVVDLDKRCAAAESSALQSAEFADEYRRRLIASQEELKIAIRCAVEMNDRREQVEAFAAAVAKGDA